MKRTILTIIALGMAIFATAQQGGISPEMLGRIRQGYTDSPSDKALRNALAGNSINILATNAENASMIDTHFSDRVKTKGITDQKSSGRCWLFTGLNVLRAAMIEKYDLGSVSYTHLTLPTILLV